NSFVVDGVSANDDAADLTGTYYSEEVIDQFQVVTSGGIAEFGRASGGVVNILTKSGTNDLRGSLYGFFRNQRFDARNPIAPTKDLLTQAQYGFTLGGPLHRDRTFFFTNFEQTRRNYSAVVTIESGSANAINNRSVGGLNAVSRGTGLKNTDQTLVISNVTTVSSRTLNEARVQYTNSRLEAPVNDDLGPAVNINGVASFGIATFSPLGRDINLFEAADNVSTQRGAH